MEDKPSLGFVRQRRNLMVVSFALLFSEVSGIKISKLNVFGTEFLISEPRGVTALLWIAAFYWFVRYYQYSRFYHGKLGSTADRYMRQNIEPLIHKRWARDNPNLDIPIVDENGERNLEFSLLRYFDRFGSIEVMARLDSSKLANLPPSKELDRNITLSGADVYWLRTKAWVHAIANTTIFTDWIVPYIVLSLPVVYGIYQVI